MLERKKTIEHSEQCDETEEKKKEIINKDEIEKIRSLLVVTSLLLLF